MPAGFSYPGIILNNIRSLSLSLMTTSIILQILKSNIFTILIGILIGAYYGYRMEKQTHEFRSLGGRILKGGDWDYLVLA